MYLIPDINVPNLPLTTLAGLSYIKGILRGGWNRPSGQFDRHLNSLDWRLLKQASPSPTESSDGHASLDSFSYGSDVVSNGAGVGVLFSG